MTWQVLEDSGMMFLVHEWHNEVRLQFAIGMPFDAQFMIDLRRDEAVDLANRLLDAAEECENNRGEDGQTSPESTTPEVLNVEETSTRGI